MTSLVYDFKDIHSRMKGDLLPRKEPEVKVKLPGWSSPHLPCCLCGGCGTEGLHLCRRCGGRGLEP